ncbi:MAG: hypothetical protein HY701_00440 [Gemmatimonadetes bacterium]|nr:hypothetical protein [Gemmatimonadota bacterium]
MPLDVLVGVLDQSAHAEAADILTRARAQAERLRAEADEQVRSRREAHLSERTASLRAEMEAKLAELRRAARKEVLEARARFLDELFDLAHARLEGAAQCESYGRTLAERVREAATYLPASTGTVRCLPAVAPALRTLLAERPGLRLEEDASLGPGFVLAAGDGAIEVDGTLRTLLERLRAQLSIEVVRWIEEEACTGAT